MAPAKEGVRCQAGAHGQAAAHVLVGVVVVGQLVSIPLIILSLGALVACSHQLPATEPASGTRAGSKHAPRRHAHPAVREHAGWRLTQVGTHPCTDALRFFMRLMSFCMALASSPALPLL
jgi:hypothetical protein